MGAVAILAALLSLFLFELEGVFGDNDAVRIDGIFDLEQEQREQRGEDRHGSHDCKDDEYPDFRTQI